MSEPTHIYLNPVRAGATEEFESFLAKTVAPAVDAHRPHLTGRWQVLRGTETEDGVVTYAFVFEGGDLARDWELNLLLAEEYGEEETERLLEEWSSTFAPIDTWTGVAGQRGAREGGQVGWTFEQVLP